MKIDDRNIFLLDGAGAVLSATSTGLLLPFFYPWTGIPMSVSRSLAWLGLAFAIYSFSCFWFVKKTRPAMLLAIIGANSSYCVLSIVTAFTVSQITFWGKSYFLAEALLVFGVVVLETRVYRRSFRPTQSQRPGSF
jgi:hypothetical protein